MQLTRLINTVQEMFYSRQDVRERNVHVCVQTRDGYGNPCKRCDDVITAWIATIDSYTDSSKNASSTVREDMTVTAVEDGVYSFVLPIRSPTENRGNNPEDSCVKENRIEISLFVQLNGEAILYSPFLIFSNHRETIDRLPCTLLLEEKLGTESEKITVNTSPGRVHTSSIGRTDVSAVSSAVTLDLDRLRRQQATRERASEALRRERNKLIKEREARRRHQSVKRTGGGFVIQFSQDI
mmetsp:Transcript_34280/g.34947  ORF Transcript_34280/g.34947 Transcript_34280/m.34947 type:complete len:239 (+) Transcript_34280:2-718(+)